MLIKMAWRNIWRNKRRTLITIASILFAVLLASLMESLQKGAWGHMIKNVVNYYFGYVQIHQKGYWDEQSIDKSFALGDHLTALPAASSHIKGLAPRLESFALASTGNNTVGVLVIGIDPQAETRMTKLAERLQRGNYLAAEDDAALLAEGIAERLKLDVGDTIILVSQGYHGVNAAAKYPVKGIVRFGSPELNKQMVYLPLLAAQRFYGAEGLVTSLAVNIAKEEQVTPVVKALKRKLDPEHYEVMDWPEMMPDLLQAKALDSAGNYIVYFILYLVIAFGILGTILMMTKEREYEFGVLVAIGMGRFALGFMVWLEIILLGMLGALVGIAASFPVVWYFYVNPIRFTGDYAGLLEKFGFEPIFPAAFNAQVFLTQAIIVLLLTSVLAIYPIFKIKRLEPVHAMRGD
jgi:putative ABC transport system permease protein